MCPIIQGLNQLNKLNKLLQSMWRNQCIGSSYVWNVNQSYSSSLNYIFSLWNALFSRVYIWILDYYSFEVTESWNCSLQQQFSHKHSWKKKGILMISYLQTHTRTYTHTNTQSLISFHRKLTHCKPGLELKKQII